MQEEVTQKTIALYVKVGKGAARLTEQALQKAIQKFLEQKSKPAHGKQTMRQLMKQNAGVSNIEITDENGDAWFLCTWCEELFPESELREDVDLGHLCDRCIMAIHSRGESLTLKY